MTAENPNIGDGFSACCRVLFGREIGELAEFKPYLAEMVDRPMAAKSAISGKEIHLSRQHYAKTAKFASLDEIAASNEAISINEIKDIDSVLSALPEKFHYTANKNLGQCIGVEESDACNDSADVLSSLNVLSSKQVAYSNGVRASEAIFGCMLCGEVSHSVRSQMAFYSRRLFESYMSMKCSDLAYCFNMRASSSCMFCFNQASAMHCIGNLKLGKEKYAQLRGKLMGEAALLLSSRKKLPSLFEAIGGGVA